VGQVVNPLEKALPAAYIKDATYGGSSVLHGALRIGTSGDERLRVTLGSDGGFIQANALDQDGKPVNGAQILIVPAGADSEAALAGALVRGETGPDGAYRSPVLAPGKYQVLATRDLVDDTPDSIGRIWRSQSSAATVEVAPNATVGQALSPANFFHR